MSKTPASPLELVLITGMSGSGKSVALRALEDVGYYCVDNLPPELLLDFVALERQVAAKQVAIAMDVRSAISLPLVPAQLRSLREQGVAVRSLFLDSTTETLVRRFSETRRRHPLSGRREAAKGVPPTDERHALVDAIELERELLADLREEAHVIDSSVIRPAQLQAHLKSLLSAPTSQLTLVFESFAFKRGIPVDADYVFDVRMLPNPHYEPELRELTGRDAPVIAYLEARADVARMRNHIQSFLDQWLEPLARDHRSYVTVAIGCTGGQHRSVYLVEQLAAAFGSRWTTLRRHRELERG
ncbi:RNase adapter RapZ [Ramlibacter tataouinensis]|uniref:p-loop-containing kinase-like protein n=1 Tax=Ramlibacter tataouinensis (strain ATCC BAA-407 / DSM 14655 / LMG 21543 / TTB310) TaxID=365046 RepID=F5XYR7_RAMTT|nr:RNase adapter RapZ [Ramlibacter tataouinensis]AEG94434.1 P-loop-containing kinase-like protein [Ramlibacter tataouinensis TTB310]